MGVGTKHTSHVVDYVSRNKPMPVEIIGSSIDVSLSGESTYIDTRKGYWTTLTNDGSNDGVPTIPSTKPSDAILLEPQCNGLSIKGVFSTSGETVTLYPLVADASGNYPTFLETIQLSGQYVNVDSKYESTAQGVDVFGYSYIKFYRDGLSAGTVQILGVAF